MAFEQLWTAELQTQLTAGIIELGADVCGCIGMDSLSEGTAGFTPLDLWPDCKGALVFAVSLPRGLYAINHPLIYGHFNHLSCQWVDQLGFRGARYVETVFGGKSIPIPCDTPYEDWDEATQTGRGLLNMKQLAVMGGLGSLGKNTLLCHPVYGNRLTVGCILTEIPLQSGLVMSSHCSDHCTRCIEACPSGALGAAGVHQKKCRQQAYGKTARGFDTVQCNQCRTQCPFCFGFSDSMGFQD